MAIGQKQSTKKSVKRKLRKPSEQCSCGLYSCCNEKGGLIFNEYLKDFRKWVKICQNALFYFFVQLLAQLITYSVILTEIFEKLTYDHPVLCACIWNILHKW